MVILGNLELIRGDLPPDNAGRNYLDDVEKAARRAASIAAQMLAYAGKGQFFVQPMDLCELVTDMMETIEASISKKAHLRCDLDADVPPVAIDVTQIQQVVMNLVTNASDALEERGGAITIRVRALDCETGYLAKTWLKTGLPAGRYVALEVADTGCGMNELALSRVFDPFFTTKFFGRGLGLPAVLGIVRGHRGAVDVESEPGKGTVFRVLLPAVQGPVVALAALEAPVGLWRGRGTVLLVDDEDTVRVLGCRMLEKLGFRALTAANGREAVRIFERQGREITCVLLDLTMPHMDGQETLLELRRLRKDVCVVLSSGYNEEDMVRRFRDAPPAGYIHKPYTLLELSARLRTVLEPSWSSFLGNGVQV
jgi:CheY-like chemotaxis protein